jgi:hypothetical protein
MSDEESTPAAEQQVGPAWPVLRIVKGDPTPEEIAALVTVLSARTAAVGGEEPPPRRSEWAGHERRMRRPVHPSPGGWRASAFPR